MFATIIYSPRDVRFEQAEDFPAAVRTVGFDLGRSKSFNGD